jgi:hypothetical protein
MFGDGIFDNDADIEQQQLEQAGNRIARLKEKGICLHGHINIKTCKCLDLSCGKTWETQEEMFKEIDDLALEYGL